MLGITMGDACGVGPEIILRVHRQKNLPPECIVIGDYTILHACNEMLDIYTPIRKMATFDDFEPDALNIYDMGLLFREDLTIGRISRKAGYAALKYVEYATDLALRGIIDAIVTLPINKFSNNLRIIKIQG